jgi:hypothetical protein
MCAEQRRSTSSRAKTRRTRLLRHASRLATSQVAADAEATVAEALAVGDQGIDLVSSASSDEEPHCDVTGSSR